VTIWPAISDAIANSTQTAVAPQAWNPADHLLSRFAFGPTAASRADITTNGPDAWYNAQVAAATTYPGYSGNADVAAQGPLLSMTPYQVRQWLKANGQEYGWAAMDQLSRVTLGLQAWSTAQLYETLVDFFNDHLHVQNHNGMVWTTRHAFDRDVIRKNVTGSFTNMLLASAKTPAMLIYLNLATSTKTAVNENYARELLELHTVGLHYTESDVLNAARILTGRTLDPKQDYQAYWYNPNLHYSGSIKVLGFTSTNTGSFRGPSNWGETAGDNLIKYLAAHAYTAQTLAQKMCVRFVSDNPSTELVTAVANAYTSSGTQILPMVSTILRSTEFWESRGQKLRRPSENLVATLRALNVGVSSMPTALQTLHWTTVGLGDAPLDWSPPNGYPDVAAGWRSAGTLLKVWGSHLSAVGGSYGGLKAPDLAALYDAPPATSGEAIDKLTRRLTGAAWSSEHLAVLQTFLGEPASTPMIYSTLKWLTGALVAVILDGPHFALR
jgi:uncharacterized protein (DUF1800 family)